MSAFVVSRAHIAALVEALFRYEVYPGDCDGTALGQLLWEENIVSVLTRYHDCTRDDMPGPLGEDFVFVWTVSPARTAYVRAPWHVFGLLSCYSYQSCEHDGWETSEACHLMTTLQTRVLTSMGYATEEEAYKHRHAHPEMPWCLYEEPV